MKQLNVENRQVDPKTIKLLDLNARYMRSEQYARLVQNIKEDGCLTSVPFCWVMPDGRLEVLSGNHRVTAAVDAGLELIDVKVCTDELPADRRIAIQISHNSIAGEDDPAVLRELYEAIGDVDLRQYSAVDDKTLGLLAAVDVGSLNDANLSFTSVQIVFLPNERDAAAAALEEARKLGSADEQWLGMFADHSRLLDSLDLTKAAYRIGNTATALHLVLDIFDRHKTDLAEGWLDAAAGEVKHTGEVPLASILSRDTMPAQAAVTLARAVSAVCDRMDIPDQDRWRALELIAADYLAGPDPDGHPQPPAD